MYSNITWLDIIRPEIRLDFERGNRIADASI